MCEMLVRVVDKVNEADPYAHARLTKAGDVIVICEDGWEWGRAEGPPDYMVVRVPGAPVGVLSGLLADQPSNGEDVLRQRRAFGLDMAQVKGTMSLQSVQAARVRKPYEPDPNVMG